MKSAISSSAISSSVCPLLWLSVGSIFPVAAFFLLTMRAACSRRLLIGGSVLSMSCEIHWCIPYMFFAYERSDTKISALCWNATVAVIKSYLKASGKLSAHTQNVPTFPAKRRGLRSHLLMRLLSVLHPKINAPYIGYDNNQSEHQNSSRHSFSSFSFLSRTRYNPHPNVKRTDNKPPI